MYIECINNNGTPYLRLVEGHRAPNKNGVMSTRKKVVTCIGPLSRFDDGKPDYVKRLKDSFKAGKPLIPTLQPYCSEESVPETYPATFSKGSPDCFGHPKFYSHLLLERILEELGLRNVFAFCKRSSKLKYDVYGFAKLLIFGRILNPESKSATVKQNEDYYEPILGPHNPDNVFDTLDFIYEYKDKIIRRMNTNLVKKAHRSPDLIYYDVTNFYFEIDEPDDDILDMDGNVLEKGLRKMGVSKENRKQPIVQMGLFMDNDGIPIAVESFPGNTLDHLTMRPALQKNIDGLEFSRFILVSDRGFFSYVNFLHILDQGNGYIIAKSLLKSSKKEQEWAYSDEDYIHLSENFKYKSRIIKHTSKDENGLTRTIEEQAVVYWSKSFQERSEKENKHFLEFLEKLEKSPENFRITAIQSKSIRKFLKKECMNRQTGELLNSSEIRPLIDFEKVAKFREELGYYQIVTSELTMDPLEVIKKYNGLTQIEDQFRVMKGNLETRPLYVRTPEHVTAHLLVCMIALVALRIIQKRVCDSGAVQLNEETKWSYGVSVERIQNALRKWKIDLMPENLYRFMDVDDPDLKLILDAFGIDIPAKLYTKGELKNIKTGMNIFT